MALTTAFGATLEEDLVHQGKAGSRCFTANSLLMPEEGRTPNHPSPDRPKKDRPDPAPARLEHEENQLWRWALGLIVLLAVAVAVLSWEQLKDLPYRLWAIPVGLFALLLLFAAYAFGRKREVADLRQVLQGFQERATLAPTEDQLDDLAQLIARSQRSFKELIDSLDDVALAFSLDGTLRTVNRRATHILGVSYSDLLGHKPDSFLAAPPIPETPFDLARFLEKRSWTGVVAIQLKNNPQRFYYDCIVSAIVKDNDVIGASVLARDITEQRTKENRFTQLFETLQEGVYICSPEGNFLEVNPALVAMLGYRTKEELLALPPEALKVNSGGDSMLGGSGNPAHETRTREVQLKRKDGGIAICQDTSTAVIEEGRTVRYQGTLIDITEKRSMERQLQRQEEFRRYLLESFPDLILVLDLKGKYTFVSPRIREILGYGPEELLGTSVEASGKGVPELANLHRSVATGESSRASCECEARHQDGSMRTMLAMAGPMMDAEGKSAGVIISARDMTTEKKLEQQVIQSERLAAMGQMIGGFAHELNNPLTAILGNAQLLEDAEIDNAARKRLETLNQEARKAADIVKNLQFFARPPAPGRTPVDLNELVQRIVQLQAYPLRKSNITVDFLPETSLPAVLGDSNQLMQVFLNLLLNAEQAIREVGEQGTIRVRLGRGAPGRTIGASAASTDVANKAGASKAGSNKAGANKDTRLGATGSAGENADSVWVVFQDDGPGIPAENLAQIFDPFFTTKRPGRGTGLGLSICKTVLREHGGNIEAASAPGGGAVFTLTLPIAKEAEAGAAGR